MTAVFTLLAAYVLGGLTFLPLLLLAVLVHGYFTLPERRKATGDTARKVFREEEDNLELKERLVKRKGDQDVAAGYFAVCREYVPGGINGKPPERTTPAGEAIATESPSVYQSMYRSIFERKTPVPSLEGGRAVKKARNVFYVVLRHGHLMLFDNSEQVEVRHVIALQLYTVDIYGGEKELLEGELYVKRNSIRLQHRTDSTVLASKNMPFYFFSENCSEKEDFYHAILRSQASGAGNANDAPTSQKFDTEDMISLIRNLHLSEENVQTRWLNALVGRVFLALYKTPETEHVIRAKITKKIDRAPKPNFITSLKLEEIDMGHGAPTIVNTRLREMTVDGNVILEADLKYSGNFRAMIAAVARLELGAHFKPRNVNLMLAGVLKRLEGHLLIRLKPPPSNRLWISFESMPRLEMNIEPIVSTRQITYGVVLRAIESRIREVMSETIVYPNWDDIPFTDTRTQRFRGGIWQRDQPEDTLPDLASALAQRVGVDGTGDTADILDAEPIPLSIKGKSMSLPTVAETACTGGNTDIQSEGELAIQSVSGTSPKSPPKFMRSPSFDVTAAEPIVTLDSPSTTDASKEPRSGAVSAMREINRRSRESSPIIMPDVPVELETPLRQRTPSASSIPALSLDRSGVSRTSQSSIERATRDDDIDARSISTSVESNLSGDTASSARLRSLKPSAERRAALNNQLESATAAAKKWGLNVLNRQAESWKNRQSAAAAAASTGQPYGRGQPLPPPGQPLPGPETSVWSPAALGSLKRKPVPSLEQSMLDSPNGRGPAPALPPRAPQQLNTEPGTQSGQSDTGV